MQALDGGKAFEVVGGGYVLRGNRVSLKHCYGHMVGVGYHLRAQLLPAKIIREISGFSRENFQKGRIYSPLG